MPARDPESFNRIFAFDTDTGILSIIQDQLDGSTALTVSLKFTDGTGNGTTDVAVSILSESSILLSDKTAAYTGEGIEIDPATVTGSTGTVVYTYYSDENCTKQLDSAPVEAGTYYVIASVAEDENYYGASSEPAKLIITPADVKKDDTSTGSTSNGNTSDRNAADAKDAGTTAAPSATPTQNSNSAKTNAASGSTGVTSTSSTPKTGDAAPLLPLTGLFTGALAAIGGCLKFRKRI